VATVLQDIVENFEVQYIAGGATQNSIRVAQWLAQAPTTSYIGCIGKDAYGEQLKTAAGKDGVETHYLEDEVNPTPQPAATLDIHIGS
jgi:adenosine kinase